MIEISVTETFIKLYNELPLKIQAKAKHQTQIFQQNPFYPSLRTKKLEPHHKEVWSFRVDKNYRVIFHFISSQKVHLLFIGDRKYIYR